MDFTLSTLSPVTGNCSTVLDDASCMFLSLVLSPVSRSRRRLVVGSNVPTTPFLPKEQPANDDQFSHRDPLKLQKKQRRRRHGDADDNDEEDDDDTVSTVTATSIDEDEEEMLSLSGSSSSCYGDITSTRSHRSVSFATPLVTSVQYRPRCTQEDKYYLHYSEHDYIDFKLEYLTKGNSPLVRKSPRKVGFARDVVASTHVVLGLHERRQLDLYYQEMELQQFLDDFVTSLQQHYPHPYDEQPQRR